MEKFDVLFTVLEKAPSNGRLKSALNLCCQFFRECLDSGG